MAGEKRAAAAPQRATLQHLQALQSGRPLEPLPGPTFAGDRPEPPEKFPTGGEQGADLEAAVRTAEFWISLLEGERSELLDESKKHKQRLQDSTRVAEAKASALRAAEGETRRLEAELRYLRESRDKAICERSIAKDSNQRIEQNKKLDMEAMTAKAENLEEVLAQERQEKTRLEQAYVQTKVRYADVLQQKDSMECLISYYEEQLKTYNPAFEKVDVNAARAWLRPAKSPDVLSEIESNASDMESARRAGANPTETQTSDTQQGKSRAMQKLAKIRGMFKKNSGEKEDKSGDKDSQKRGSSRPSLRRGSSGAGNGDQPPPTAAAGHPPESCGPTPRTARSSHCGEPQTPTLRPDDSAMVSARSGGVSVRSAASPNAAGTSRESSAAPSEARPRRLKRWEMRNE